MGSAGWRIFPARTGEVIEFWGSEIALRPLQFLVAAPEALFLAALTAMLLRHPDVQFYEIDRVTFGLLVVAVVLRAVVLRQRILVWERASWPMAGLALLALASLLNQPFEPEAWSLFASKLVVPFVLFHLAGAVFADGASFKKFEIFAIILLAYLSFTAIAFLVGAQWLVFPRFILDESLGFHVDRARGPLLQAVANGVSINILGVLALHAYRRGSVRGNKMILLLASVPVAILATMTRAVWLSFVGTVVAVALLSKNRAVRRRWIVLVIAGMGALAILVWARGLGQTVSDRLEEKGPVEYRQAVYAGGWEMVLEHPWIGWGFHQMPAELPRHVSGYQEKVLYPHNTYLELLVEHGFVGFGLYLWLMWELWRLRKGSVPAEEEHGFLDCEFHRLWPILLAIYWVNAAAVVMSYQFVNGLLFTLAGMLAAQRRRAEAAAW